MDDNTAQTGQQISGVQANTGATTPPPLPSQPVQPTQPVQQQPTPSAQAQDAGSKITLQDLYGPSSPEELQTQQPVPTETAPIVAPQTGVPEQAVAPQETQMTSQPQAIFPEQAKQKELPAAPQAVEQTKQVAETEHQDDSSGGGGFHFSKVVRFIFGGLVIIVVLLLVWGLISLLFSNRGGSTGGKVSLIYWGLWEDSNVMQGVLADFQKQHPNITVTYIKQDPKDYTKRLLTRMQDGTGPDIFRLHNTWVYPLQSVLLPLPTSVLDNKQLTANYPPVVAKDMTANGAIYGLPLSMDTLSLFVNTDIFSHAGATVPTTWDNFITVAKALTVKDPNGHIQTAGAALGTYDNIAHAPDIISLLLLQNGATMQKLQGTNVTDALSFYTTFARPDGNVWDSTLDNSLVAFSKGKVAMYFGYSYDIFAIQAANPNLKFSIYPVPHLTGRDMTVASYWVEGISNKSKHQKEAIELLQYLAQKDVQTRLYTDESKTRPFGELYARTDLANSLTANPLLAPFVMQYKTAQSSIFVGDTDYDEYNGALNQYLGNAINSMLQDTSADSATATLAQGVAQVTSQYAPKTQ